MLGGNFSIAGLVLAAGIGATVFAEHMAGRDPLRCKEREYSVPTTGNGQRASAGTVEARYQAPDCAVPKTDNEADLCQQRRMAYAAEESACISRWQFWVSLFGLGGLLGTIVYSARSARTAAEAARYTARSVDVQIRIEQPLLFVRMSSHVEPPDWQKIDMDVENYGKTPAIVIEWSAECRAINDLPDKLEYSRIVKSRGMVLGPSGKPLSLPVILADVDAQAICSDQATACLWGYFRYEDALGRTRVKGFGFKCHPYVGDDGFEFPASFGLLWVRAGGKHYNYDHSEEDF